MKKERNLPFENDDSRLRILFLYQLLREQTDENHMLSTPQIIEKMETSHGIKMHRTTLSRDIEVLRAAGINVKANRKRALHYYLEEKKEERERVFFSVREAAEMLGLSRPALYSLIQKEEIPFIRIGSKILINLQQLHKWIEDKGSAL